MRLGGGGGGRCTKVFSTTVRQDLQHVPIFAVNHSNPLCKLYFTHQLFQATAFDGRATAGSFTQQLLHTAKAITLTCTP